MRRFFIFSLFVIILLSLKSCSTYPISLSKDKDERNRVLTYDYILDSMNDISNRDSSTIEDMALYIIIYLSGLKLKYELDKFTYLLECHVSEDGSMQNVIIKNSEIKGSNDQCIIDYLMKMPRCEFWDTYSGTDKDSITIINIPLHFSLKKSAAYI